MLGIEFTIAKINNNKTPGDDQVVDMSKQDLCWSEIVL
jgi:hypothetical protein